MTEAQAIAIADRGTVARAKDKEAAMQRLVLSYHILAAPMMLARVAENTMSPAERERLVTLLQAGLQREAT